jgi:hypothetical protein
VIFALVGEPPARCRKERVWPAFRRRHEPRPPWHRWQTPWCCFRRLYCQTNAHTQPGSSGPGPRGLQRWRWPRPMRRGRLQQPAKWRLQGSAMAVGPRQHGDTARWQQGWCSTVVGRCHASNACTGGGLMVMPAMRTCYADFGAERLGRRVGNRHSGVADRRCHGARHTDTAGRQDVVLRRRGRVGDGQGARRSRHTPGNTHAAAQEDGLVRLGIRKPSSPVAQRSHHAACGGEPSEVGGEPSVPRRQPVLLSTHRQPAGDQQPGGQP